MDECARDSLLVASIDKFNISHFMYNNLSLNNGLIKCSNFSNINSLSEPVCVILNSHTINLSI